MLDEHDVEHRVALLETAWMPLGTFSKMYEPLPSPPGMRFGNTLVRSPYLPTSSAVIASVSISA